MKGLTTILRLLALGFVALVIAPVGVNTSLMDGATPAVAPVPF